MKLNTEFPYIRDVNTMTDNAQTLDRYVVLLNKKGQLRIVKIKDWNYDFRDWSTISTFFEKMKRIYKLSN